MSIPSRIAVLAVLLTSMTLIPAAAVALPTCVDLGTSPEYGLVGNPALTFVSATQVPATATTPTHCEVLLTQSTPGLSGPAAGYAEGQSQSIRMRIVLPEKAAWNGKLMASTGPGSQGQINSSTGFLVGTNSGSTLPYAIQLGYVGSMTDAGHVSGEEFAVIQSTRTLNVGKLTDWVVRASTDTTRWAKAIARTYYGAPVSRAYWNGCSGGGLQGMTQAQLNAAEYDGFLIGAPAIYWARWQLSRAWAPIVAKDLLTPYGKSLSAAQIDAANRAAVAACDGIDGVIDGVLADARACTFSAKANICGVQGAPASPNCLDAQQADAMDRIWDGPRNTKGARVWFPSDRGVNFSVTPPATIALFQWGHADLTFDWRTVTMETYAEEVELVTNTVSELIDTQDAELEGARRRGAKIILLHGTADATIFAGQSLDYYRRVAAAGGGTPDYAGLQSWFRFFLMPGLGHCYVGFGGLTTPGVGATDPFPALVNWVENGVAPDTILGSGSSVPGRTRPLCPYPKTAVYNGSGDINDARNHRCGGNLETKQAVCFQLRTKYQQETSNALDTFGRENPAACNENSKVPMR